MDGVEMVRRYRALEAERSVVLGAAEPLESCAVESTPATGTHSHSASVESGRPLAQRALTLARPPMPIVGISANSNLIGQPQATDAGMNAFLSKPFTLADLNRVVSSTLNKPL